MKFLHLADLHFGKSIYGVSMLENGDQIFWVEQFLKLVQDIHPDAIVISGDIYDRSTPSGDAVELLDIMVTALAEMEIPVLIVAGNHDSGQRLSFGGSLLAKQNVHIAGVLSEELTHVTFYDSDGPVTFWLMPYVFPALVAQVLNDESIRDYDAAVKKLLERQEIDFTKRNVLVAHQNVTANGKEAERGGSESMVGGVGQIDYHTFDGFDYVALGHIHSSYPVGRKTVRYAGSPLCYHFSETKQLAKGPVLVELGAKRSDPVVETKVIPPLHPMREIRGTYDELRKAELENKSCGEYIRVVLTDQRPSPEIYGFFHNLFDGRNSVFMEIISEYSQFVPIPDAPAASASEKSVEALFADFYSRRQGGAAPDAQEEALMRFVGEQVRHSNPGDDQKTKEKQIDTLLKFVLEQEET